jgi:thioredoxin reductase/NAD-dependent dihydropyrimidine dehydrogenase PreA subunit
MGSAACVRACPEEKALVVVDGRAHLAQASGCVGHGACQSACPVDAITLVFGTARRGVDLPQLDEHFETSQQGLYIAGELGGMGLIATAVRQGVKAVGAIAASLAAEGERRTDALPLLVIGAGPAGIAASLEAHRLGLKVRLVEKETSIGGSVRRYPRGKIVMTTPADLPLYGRVHLRRTSKAALIELWEDVFARATVDAEFGVNVESVVRDGDVLVASTSVGAIAARRILLATGRRGKPRRLEVPGEELGHVHHVLEQPEAHDGQACLVVGGGDVAVEAAIALAERPGTRVTLCHRGDRFERAKPENQERLAAAEARGLRVLRGAQVERLDAASAEVVTNGDRERVDATSVFVLIGTELPSNLLSSSGVQVRTYRGEPVVAR